MAKKTFDDDDGRVIADMSDIERTPLIIPRLDHLHKKKEPEEKTESNPWENADFSSKEKRSFIAGALGATLLVASIFAVVGGIVIFLISRMG